MDRIIEDTFIEKASLIAEDSDMRLGAAKYFFEQRYEGKYREQSAMNKEGENYAFAIELALKCNIIYDDFRRNPRFNQLEDRILSIDGNEIQCFKVGTENWRRSVASKVNGLKILSDPRGIKQLILENDPLDERGNIETDPRYNANFRTLSADGQRPNGHSLYAYYQLQSPVAKSLINTEYYCYVEDEIKYTVYALLTDDILATSHDGKTIIPKEMMQSLDESKSKAIDLRYASISGEDIKPNELKFLEEFSKSSVQATEFRFPIPTKYEQIDFERYDFNKFKYNRISIFEQLDKVTKYNLQRLFNDKELEDLIRYLKLLVDAGKSINDITVFVNLCIYFKDFVTNRMNIALEFTEKKYARIDNFYILTKAFQPFDDNSKLLRDNDAFKTENQINRIKEEVTAKQEDREISELQELINENIQYEIKNDETSNNYIKQNEIIAERVKKIIQDDRDKALELVQKVKGVYLYLPLIYREDKEIAKQYSMYHDIEQDCNNSFMAYIVKESPMFLKYFPEESKQEFGEKALEIIDEELNANSISRLLHGYSTGETNRLLHEKKEQLEEILESSNTKKQV